MHSHFLDMCRILRTNVLAYEYSGYGCSTGEASEQSLYKDVDAAFEFLVDGRSVAPTDIILYGQSVGSAPTLDLASRVHVGGVVLHAGLKSGLSVLKDEVTSGTHWFDAFKNVDKIQKVHCPVFVLHGTNDEDVRLEHGKALHAAAPNAVNPWWVVGGGHNNIEVEWRNEYFSKLNEFVKQTVVELVDQSPIISSPVASNSRLGIPHKWPKGNSDEVVVLDRTKEELATNNSRMSSWWASKALLSGKNRDRQSTTLTSQVSASSLTHSPLTDERLSNTKLLCADQQRFWQPADSLLMKLPRISTQYNNLPKGSSLSPNDLPRRAHAGKSNSSL
eukprot:GHVS01058640.1.p1 GENE.GHVS01058640.1~~GHVS01058640.1.p1  ORF type:complete len:333 (+),score=45.05 GHVS01058640.1:286-1284(+)